MYNVIIWGTGNGYNHHLNLIKYFELKGEIFVKGVISNDKEIADKIDGYRFYPKSCVKNIDFDYCIVSIFDFDCIKYEAEILGIKKNQLIPIKVLEIPHFSFEKYIRLKEEGITILSRNCWAGVCYHYLCLEFQSPTINLFFSPSEFNKFVSNLDYYLSLPIEFVRMEYEKALKIEYPIGKCGDILVHFSHYDNFEEAVSAWERRKKRLNKNNIVVVSSTILRDDAIEFTKLPFKNKLIFVPKEIDIKNEACIALNYEEGGKGIGVYSNRSADGSHSIIDLLSFLNHENYRRDKWNILN